MNLDRVRSIADAVLYEGYLLYPYRASAVKNHHRFNFGLLVPQQGDSKPSGCEASSLRTECLLDGADPIVELRVRFLQLVDRQIWSEGQKVPMLRTAHNTYYAWQEAVEREVVVSRLRLGDLVEEFQTFEFHFAQQETTEAICDEGRLAGQMVRWQERVTGRLQASVRRLGPEAFRLRIDVCNTGQAQETLPRQEVLLHSMVSTHCVMGAVGGQFVSLLEPPPTWSAWAAECENRGVWPVLAGQPGERDMLLASPIILYDYPQTAPESCGNFCDSTEIDEMLALRVLTLTDAERAEMEQLDERGRKILQQTESLPPAHWQKLHGALRNMRPVHPGHESRNLPEQ